MKMNPLTNCVPQETAQLFWQLAEQLVAGELTTATAIQQIRDSSISATLTLNQLAALDRTVREQLQQDSLITLALGLINFGLAQLSGNAALIANCVVTLAEVQRQHQQYKAAIANLETARDYLRKANEPLAESTVIGNLGNIYLAIGQVHQATEHYQNALSIVRAANDEERAGCWLGSLGSAYSSLGEHQTAISYYDAYEGLIELYLAQGNALTAWTTVERCRSRTLVEQLAQTAFAPPTGVAATLLAEEARCLTQLRRLSLAFRNATDHQASAPTNQIELVQQSLDAVLERMAPQASDYVALRRGLPVEFDDVKACLQTA